MACPRGQRRCRLSPQWTNWRSWPTSATPTPLLAKRYTRDEGVSRMTTAGLDWTGVSGFRSIAQLERLPLGPVNVLIKPLRMIGLSQTNCSG